MGGKGEGRDDSRRVGRGVDVQSLVAHTFVPQKGRCNVTSSSVILYRLLLQYTRTPVQYTHTYTRTYTHVHVRHSPWDPRPAALQLHNNNTPRPPSEKPKDCAPGTTRGPLLCLGLALGLVFVRAVEKAAALHVGHTRRRYLLLLLDTGEVLVVKENHEQDKVGGVHDEAQLPVGRIDKAIVTTHLHPCCG